MENKIAKRVIAIVVEGNLTISYLIPIKTYAINKEDIKIDSIDEVEKEQSNNKDTDVENEDETLEIGTDKEKTNIEKENSAKYSNIIINSITIDNKEVEYNKENVKISIDIENPENINNLNVYYENTNGMEYMTILNYNHEANIFEGKLVFNYYGGGLQSNIDKIIIHRNNNESLTISRNDLYSYGINYHDYVINVKNYEIKNLEFDKEVAFDGDKVKVSMDMSDYPKSIVNSSLTLEHFYENSMG